MGKAIKINEAVRVIIEQNTLYQFLVSSGLVNANALARQIEDGVRAMVGKDVKVNTIAKAITKMKPAYPQKHIKLLDADVALDTDVTEMTYSIDDFKKLDARQMFFALVNGDKVKVLRRKSGNDESSDLVLLKVAFKSSSEAYHPFWLLFNNLGITPEHILRLDNVLFIFLKRAHALKALSVIESFTKHTITNP